MSSAAAAAWLETAAKDLDAVRRSLMPLPDQNLETAAYHTQQAAETGVKALPAHLGIAYARGRHGHDIALAAAAIPASNRLAKDAQALGALTPWPTAWRYPSDDPATAAPLPEATEVEQWTEKVEAFMNAVMSEIAP
ncbi:HEPN domain-containing protein [Microvirga sp. BT689]|uniref:HEPN domain-containing protein n=1 Tax=Microvirga arvi TaxID=2778731 RepID=UPI001951DB7A|nr:HEPN domain-containing protein [Microvirga arvi]MBM6583343.1 HEPN domain-containing protein [Microvirga arvi]